MWLFSRWFDRSILFSHLTLLVLGYLQIMIDSLKKRDIKWISWLNEWDNSPKPPWKLEDPFHDLMCITNIHHRFFWRSESFILNIWMFNTKIRLSDIGIHSNEAYLLQEWQFISLPYQMWVNQLSISSINGPD